MGTLVRHQNMPHPRSAPLIGRSSSFDVEPPGMDHHPRAAARRGGDALVEIHGSACGRGRRVRPR
jgi:hypothetical protein